MTRLLLAITRDGEKWVEQIAGEGDLPKHITRYGTEYRVIMAMPADRRRIADAWWQAPNAANLTLSPNVTRA
jgi:hypothetical protein